MNVRCQSCDTVYRIDPLRVPEGGVRARCTVCSNVIAVTRVAEAAAPATARTRPQHMPKTADRVANSLGDAFIPAPEDTDVVTTSPPPRAQRDVVIPVFADPDLNVVTAKPVERAPSLAEPMVPPKPSSAAPASPSPVEIASQRTAPMQAIPVPSGPPPLAEPPTPPVALEPQPQPKSEPQQEPRAPAASAAPATPSAPTAPPGDAKPAARVSRPFSLPRDLPPPPMPAAAPPKRPTAPVFRATPGQPVHTPQAAPAPAPAPPRADAGKPINPFLSRDPRQKARRLARALISDMIVYQPEKRQKALREGNLAESFREEIKKSWQEYVEQVGDNIASSTTHFNDALNDILAGGQKVF